MITQLGHVSVTPCIASVHLTDSQTDRQTDRQVERQLERLTATLRRGTWVDAVDRPRDRWPWPPPAVTHDSQLYTKTTTHSHHTSCCCELSQTNKLESNKVHNVHEGRRRDGMNPYIHDSTGDRL